MTLASPDLDRAASPATAPSAIPLIRTKLAVPGLGSTYRDRERLSEHLDRAMDDATRLALLSAPPGYGKSVAVAGWLASRAIPRAWLSLDAADNDPVRFLRYLVAALATVRPGLERDAELLLGLGAGSGVDLAGATLVDAVAAADEPFVLVLDDYHVITSEPVHALVRFLIERGPPFAHLVITTREDPPLPVARLRAHRRLVEIRADDLRLTEHEACCFIDDAGVELDGPQIGCLVQRTEGWIAGMQLAAVSLRDRPDAGAVIDAFTGTQRFVLDYLGAEVLERLDADLRAFLVRMSVCDRFNVALCRDLTGRDDCADLLARADRMNLFLIPLDLERGWFRFHHLFADYLRTLLDDREARDLHERAAAWFEREGLAGEAIGHALAAGSIDRAIRLVEQAARATYLEGEVSTLLRWIDALPPDRVAASAELISMRAFAAFNVGRVEDAAQACAEGEATAPDGAAPRLLAVRAIIAAFALRPDAIPLAQAAIEALEGDAFFLPMALQALAAGHLNVGELEPAAVAARQALDAVLGSGRSTRTVPAMTALASALNFTGHRGEAEALCRRTLADHRAEAAVLGGGTPYAIYWLGSIRYEANDLPGALNDLETAWTTMGTFGFGRALLTSAVAFIALARQASGQPEAALDAVQIVRRDARAAGLAGIEGNLAQIETRLHLLQGDLAAAGRWADHGARARASDPPTTERGAAWEAVAELATLARVRLAQDQLAEAGPLLRRARTALTAMHNVAELISVVIVEAELAEASGDRRKAQRVLEEAIALAAPERYVRRVVDDIRGTAHLLPAVRRLAPEFVDEVTAALATTGSGRAAPRAGGSFWLDGEGQPVEALTARELDVLRLMARGAGDAAIADELVVSLATAKWHAAHIRAKLGARSRTQALLRAQELGLL